MQSVRESITTTAPKTEEGSDEARAAPELSGERKEAVVDKLVKTSVELTGGLEAAERGEWDKWSCEGKVLTNVDQMSNPRTLFSRAC